MRSIKALLLSAAVSALSGCAGMSEEACLTADWRTLGFEDGVAGRSVGRISTYRQSCSNHGVAPDLDSYRSGHAEGVEIYCRASNGFTVGHSGALYQGVCPAHLEAEFVAEYNAGRQLYELESSLRDVNNQLASNARAQEDIKRELTGIAAAMISDGTSAEERITLVGRAAELGKRHSEITSHTETLEQERIDLERELYEYRQTLASEF